MSQLRWLLRYDADRRIVLIVYCRALGFDLFQRYLLSHPSTVKSHALVPSHLTCLRLVGQLCDPDVSAGEIANIIETDPALSYRFLRAAGAGTTGGFRRQLNSVREGILLLGTRRLRALDGTHAAGR